MSEVFVKRAKTINPSDMFRMNDKEVVVNLMDNNNTGRDLILIYMYQLPRFVQHGIKVGMTKCKQGEIFGKVIKTRVEVQTSELALTDEQYEKYGAEREVCYWGVCVDAVNESFKDYALHKNISFENAGLVVKEQEWFVNVPLEELVETFKKMREPKEKRIFEPRKEQRECIEKIKEYFKENKNGRFLLNCKMRFGKSYTTYKYCEEVGINKVLILTFVPAVEESWEDDLLHIKKEYKYYTDEHLKRGVFEETSKEPYVLFLSLQNYLGKTKENEVKERIKRLQNIKWDLVILDEYHFGAWNTRTQNNLKNAKGGSEEAQEDFKEEYVTALCNTKDVIDQFKIKTEKVICLSGTPFKAIARGEFNDLSSYTYSYFDEQRNKYPKSEENNFEEVNKDYEHFPDMKIFGYNMANLFADLTSAIFSENKILGKSYFSLNTFFKTKKDIDSQAKCEFIYEEEIKKWLDIISGIEPQQNYISPYLEGTMSEKVKHTLWLMPTIHSCTAMAKLLSQDKNFSKYKIINLSAQGVGAGKDALNYLKKGMKESENTSKGTIAITVNKLTIGVTVKEWSSIFVLKDLSSPEQYFQAIFRVQTPYKEKDTILKKQACVFDFNIDRASALLLRYAEEVQNEGGKSKIEIARLIVKYLPIFINGNMSEPISEDIFFHLAEFGDSSGVPLSKRIANIKNVTRIEDQDAISNMINDPETSNILKRVFAHAKFKKPKTHTRPIAQQEGVGTVEWKKGEDKGLEMGKMDYQKYLNYDNNEVQEKFEETQKKYLEMFTPKEYTEEGKVWFKNGFIKGYERGVNAPIRKMYPGAGDGTKFVEKIKEKFGADIQYCKETAQKINDFMTEYLKDENNIPEKWKGMLYKRWYVDSFKRMVRALLKPKEENAQTVEDVENILRHILSRLFEFLYISVYRETKFEEIFNNANPNRFLEAVGITKEDFKTLNKYEIFEKKTLDRFISDFFANETLGASIKPEDEKMKKYRNSFNWFGYGEIEDND